MTSLEKAVLLQGTDIFRDIGSEALTKVGTITDEVIFDRGTVLFCEDDPADALYVVVTGLVRLTRRGREIKTVGPQEVFGAWAAFDSEPRIVTATVVEDLQALKIAYEDLRDLILENMEVGRGIFKALSRQIREMMADEASGRRVS